MQKRRGTKKENHYVPLNSNMQDNSAFPPMCGRARDTNVSKITHQQLFLQVLSHDLAPFATRRITYQQFVLPATVVGGIVKTYLSDDGLNSRDLFSKSLSQTVKIMVGCRCTDEDRMRWLVCHVLTLPLERER